MANTKSALKELRKGAKLQIYNKKIKDNVKTLIKKSKKAIEIGDKKAEKVVKTTLKAIDKAKQKGIIKKNTADRKKSRLHAKLNESKSRGLSKIQSEIVKNRSENIPKYGSKKINF